MNFRAEKWKSGGSNILEIFLSVLPKMYVRINNFEYKHIPSRGARFSEWAKTGKQQRPLDNFL